MRESQGRFDRVAPRYEVVNRLLAFGMDRRWRRRAASALDLPAGSVVLDVGCGTGALHRELERLPLRSIGIDLSEGMLRVARHRGARPFVLADALRLPVADACVDGACSAFALRDVGDPARLLAELGRVLRPGGKLVVVEVAVPERAPARALHRFYLGRVAPAIGGAISDREAYRAFGKSMATLPSAMRMSELFAGAGFDNYRRSMFNAGAVQLLTASRR